MLQLELLRARTRKGQIRPIYADISQRNLDLCTRIIEAFQANINEKKGKLQKEISQLEDADFDYRLVRGLSAILQRECVFTIDAAVNPRLARRLVFEEATRQGPVISDSSRGRIMNSVATELGVSISELEGSFQADLDDELLLRKFTPLIPVELLKRYNFALTQTLLFRSTFMEIRVSDSWKNILRAVKFQGLMYSAEAEGGIFKITVDGPHSIFKLTQRYGTRMAKILPHIVQAPHWNIFGGIIRTGQFGKRILQLRLSSEEIGELIKPDESRIQLKKPGEQFDSRVEREFFKRFQTLNSGWTITREPTPLIAGRHVFIPDFIFEKNGMRVYMEIAGFWTEKYLETKLKKLQQLPNVDMIVAADEKHACERLKHIRGELIFYKRKVPLRPIWRFLKLREEELLNRQMTRLDPSQLHFQGDVIQLQAVAERSKVPVEVLVKKMKANKLEGYRMVGNLLVSDGKLEQLDQKIASLKDPLLSEVISLLEQEGVDRPYDVLSALDYGVKWSGLDIEKSSIYKRQPNKKNNDGFST
jgi:predicted nuclease of restriction endonuclease-like RecB superfamily